MAAVDTNIQSPTAAFETRVTNAHFGSGFEARNSSLSEGSSAATVIESLDICLLRYPGGTQTESYFDPANPDSANPTNIFTGSKASNFEGISDFLDFSSRNGIQTIVVIPTYRYFDKNASENGYLADNAAKDITEFVQKLLIGAYGDAEIYAFEIGNEWFNSNTVYDASENPDGWTAAEFGILQGKIAEIVNSATMAVSADQIPDIWVQSSQNGSTDVDGSGVDDNSEIISGLSSAALSAIDGVVDHFYQPTRAGTPLEVISQGLVASNRIERLVAAGWNVNGDNALDIITTEWNVRAARNAGATGNSANITGFERLPLFLATFADMITSGVDLALVYTAQAIGADGGSGTLSEYGQSSVTPTGILFDLMSHSLPGTRLVDPNADGMLSESEYIFLDADGIEAGVMYTYVGDDRTVLYYASAVNEALNFRIGGFSDYISSGYTISASIIHVAEGDSPLDYDADGYSADLSYSELDGEIKGDGILELTLLPYEVAQISLVYYGDESSENFISVYEVNGSGENDTLWGSKENDTIRGRDGDDSIHGEEGNDILYGGPGSDHVWGGDGNDRLDGGSGDNFLGGGNGDDTIVSVGENDTVSAGLGDDFILLSSARATVDGDDGFDTISLSHSDGGVNFWFDDKLLELHGRLAISEFTGIESFIGSAFGDFFRMFDGYAEVDLGAGDDVFYLGRLARGFFFGGDGDDFIFSASSLATIDGGSGDDGILCDLGGTVCGGEGNDTIISRLGSSISGGAGDDDISCGLGADTLIFGSNDGNDVVRNFNWDEDEIIFDGILESYLMDEAVKHYALAETKEGTKLDFNGDSSILFVGTDIASVSEGLFDFLLL